MPKTVAQKLWDAHIVTSTQGEPDLLFVDLHLVHEVTSPQAFEGLRLTNRRVRRPDLTVATMDHDVPTLGGPAPPDELPARHVSSLEGDRRRRVNPLPGTGETRPGIVASTA